MCKNLIINLALDLIRIGYEIIYLANEDKLVDFEFRAEQIYQILHALKGIKK